MKYLFEFMLTVGLFDICISQVPLQNIASVVAGLPDQELRLEQAVLDSFFELHNRFCCLWWGQNMCFRNDQWMAVNCPNTCGTNVCTHKSIADNNVDEVIVSPTPAEVLVNSVTAPPTITQYRRQPTLELSADLHHRRQIPRPRIIRPTPEAQLQPLTPVTALDSLSLHTLSSLEDISTVLGSSLEDASRIVATARPPTLPLKSQREIALTNSIIREETDTSGVSLVEPPISVRNFLEDGSGVDLDDRSSIEKSHQRIPSTEESEFQIAPIPANQWRLGVASPENRVQPSAAALEAAYDSQSTGPKSIPLPVPPEFEDPEIAGKLLSRHLSPEVMKLLDPNHKPGSPVILPYRYMPKDQDKDQFCCFWTSLGFCSLNREWMGANCNEACLTKACRGLSSPNDFFASKLIQKSESQATEKSAPESNLVIDQGAPLPSQEKPIIIAEPVLNTRPQSTLSPVVKVETIVHTKSAESTETSISEPESISVEGAVTSSEYEELHSVDSGIREVVEANLDSSSASLDNEKLCCFWATRGLCADNVEWMNENCRSSCSLHGCATLSSLRSCNGPEMCARQHNGKRYRRCSCDDDSWGRICSEKHSYPEGPGERCHGPSYNKSYYHRYFHLKK